MSAITRPVPPPPAPERVSPAHSPQAPQPSSRWKLWALLLILVVAVVGGYQLWQARQAASQATALPAFQTAEVGLGIVEETIRLSGATAARQYADLSAPRLVGPDANRAMILQKLVPSGSKVRKGDVVALIDGESLLDHIDDVHSTVVQAELDVTKRRAEQSLDIANLEQSLRLAKAEWDKAKLDHSAAEIRAAIDQELLALMVEEAAARYKQLQADLPFKKASHEAELKTLDYTTLRHVRHRDRHKRDAERFTVYAPMDGLAVMRTVVRGGGDTVQVAEGDQVGPGQAFMKIVDLSSMQLEATVNQAESSMIRIGQEARVGLDAFPGVTFKGRIQSIGALAAGGWRENFYIRSVPVVVTIDGADPRLIPDLSAYADVVIGKSEKSVVAPLAAIHDEDGKTYVYVRQGKNFEKREVQVGRSNNLHAAILSGLEPGEHVRIN